MIKKKRCCRKWRLDPNVKQYVDWSFDRHLHFFNTTIIILSPYINIPRYTYLKLNIHAKWLRLNWNIMKIEFKTFLHSSVQRRRLDPRNYLRRRVVNYCWKTIHLRCLRASWLYLCCHEVFYCPSKHYWER